MGAITDSLEHVATTLRAAGVSCTTDPRDLNLPAVWITLDKLRYDRLDGHAATVDVSLIAIVDDTGHPGALEALDTITAATNTALGTAEWDARAVLLISHSPAPLPGMATTLTVDWRP